MQNTGGKYKLAFALLYFHLLLPKYFCHVSGAQTPPHARPQPFQSSPQPQSTTAITSDFFSQAIASALASTPQSSTPSPQQSHNVSSLENFDYACFASLSSIFFFVKTCIISIQQSYLLFFMDNQGIFLVHHKFYSNITHPEVRINLKIKSHGH